MLSKIKWCLKQLVPLTYVSVIGFWIFVLKRFSQNTTKYSLKYLFNNFIFLY